jgi:hypothetical protein
MAEEEVSALFWLNRSEMPREFGDMYWRVGSLSVEVEEEEEEAAAAVDTAA